jgi:hypothetical protein
LLVAFGADVRAEEPSAKGCSDITLKMPKGIYVMELKYDDTADAALEQINRKGYADKYALEGRLGDSTSGIGRPVTKVGIAFSSKERRSAEGRLLPEGRKNITEWKAVKA